LKRKGADYHHGDLRRALVEATSRLVEEYGLEGFTLRAAARLAGVSDGAPYHHFADREALLAAVAEHGFRKLCDEMSESAERERGGPQRKGVAMGVAYVLFAARNPARFRLMFGPLVHSKDRYPELAEAAERAYDLVRTGIGQSAYERPYRMPARGAVLNRWALVHGLSMLAIDGHLHQHAATERSLKRLVSEAIEWLGGREPPRERESGVPTSGRRPRLREERERPVATRR
jgi:AcrR family transcriptional regulator